MQNPPPDLVRTTLGVLFIGALIAAAFWILRPFIGATIWATMLVVATWPVMKWVEARLWGRRSLAVLVMTLLMLMLFMVPLMVAIATIVSHLDDIISQAKTFAAAQIPHPPQWVGSLPFVGEKIVQVWEQAVSGGPSGLVARLTPYADDIAKWFVSQAGSIGSIFLQFLLTVIVSALMYAGGESAALAVHRFGRRLAGVAGDNVVTLAGQAIRAVALGVGVTALVQSGLGGIALAIAGVPFAGLLAAVMLLLCIAQLGPGLVMFPAVAWLYWTDQTGWGTFLLVCSIVVVTMDNFLRPALIKRGADLPILLIFAGVIGGLLAFGLVGIFVGPVMLAVVYTLLDSWVGDGTTSLPAPEGH
jgi:predicted PurR-regulated permease PerM